MTREKAFLEAKTEQEQNIIIILALRLRVTLDMQTSRAGKAFPL